MSLDEMLIAREQRVAWQEEALLGASDKALICFTLNIVGPMKAFPQADQTFDEGSAGIQALLKSEGVAFEIKRCVRMKTGYTLLVLAEYSPVKLKALLCQLEENHPLGRFFDIDIIARSGKISRQDIGMPERKCILCDHPAFICSRSRQHTVEELQHKTLSVMGNYFLEREAKALATSAIRALLYEVAVSPKPGLVDRLNNGSHRDMNFYTFISSATALYDYFFLVAKAGLTFTASPDILFKQCRYLGRLAEAQMHAATHDVNTHKGAIFSMGILCAAAGYVFTHNGTYTTETLRTCVEQMTGSLRQELLNVNHPRTSGEHAFIEYRCGGIREEACNGFPSVFNVAYPVLKQIMEQTGDCDTAGCAALLHLMGCVNDTCLIKRGGYDELIYQRSKSARACQCLDSYEKLMQEMKTLDDEYISKNLSVGGCADLMAVAWFVYFVTTKT